MRSSKHLVDRRPLRPLTLRKVPLQMLNSLLQLFCVVGPLVPTDPKVVSRLGTGIAFRVFRQEMLERILGLGKLVVVEMRLADPEH